MPIPKERIYALVDAAADFQRCAASIREACRNAIILRQANAISEPELFQRISESFEIFVPDPASLAVVKYEHAWRISTGPQNEYRRQWMAERRRAGAPKPLTTESLSTRGLSRAQILQQFRSENAQALGGEAAAAITPATVTLETIGLGDDQS